MRDLELRLEASRGYTHALKPRPASGSILNLTAKASGGLAAGRCHICRDLAPVEHILAVGHWVCLRCQDRFLSRGLAFMEAMCRGESLDCCGPIARLG
jgi:hypothetical protein